MLSLNKRIGQFAVAVALSALCLPFTAQAQDVELALSAQMPLGTLARQTAEGGERSLSTLRGPAGTVVVFWSNECPWAAKYEQRLSDLAGTYTARGIAFVLVNSNDPVAFPKESQPEGIRHASSLGGTYIIDADGQLARAFGAARTPHVYVFDSAGALAYAGTIDDSPGDPGNVQASYLRDALDAVASGVAVTVPRTKAFGCTVKMRPAN